MEKRLSIIVRMPNWIGDLIMATPILEDLRQNFPEDEITAMCQRPHCSILEKDPHINELFCFSKCGVFTRREERRNVVRKLKKGSYDIGILLTNSFSSAWLFWQGNIERRIGFKKHFRSFLLTDGLKYPPSEQRQHQVEVYKKLLKPLGIISSSTLPKVYLEEKEKNEAWEMLKKYGINRQSKLIGINPGAAYGSAKCWLPERFEEVTRNLLNKEQDLFVLFVGDVNTKGLIKKICQNLPNRAVNLAGLTSLRQLMAIISLCHAFLTNDSGPMHIASALHIPLVALFGSTDEVTTGPYKGGKIIHKHVSCSPCFQRKCPIDFKCMKEIGVDEVYQALLEALEKGKKHA